MSATLAIGAVIVVIGVVLAADLLGAGDFVMRNVTMRPLGSLPPGYAASKTGFRVYAALVVAIGLLFAGFGVAETAASAGVVLFGIGVLGFVVLSVLAIRGEITTATRKP